MGFGDGGFLVVRLRLVIEGRVAQGGRDWINNRLQKLNQARQLCLG